jgi:hypothetical protein
MHQIYRFFLGLLLTASLAGCALISAADMVFLALALPGPVQEGTVELPGYSLGPMSSEARDELLLAAIPPDEGIVQFTGRVDWTGLSRLKQPMDELNQSVGAITDFSILFLWWSKANERYEVLIRLPFTEIHSIELWTPGLGTSIRICLEMDRIPIADDVLGIDRNSTLRVLKSGVFTDAEKTEALFHLLDPRLPGPADLNEQPDLCDEAPAPGEQSPIGFGSCDPSVEKC